MRKLCFLLSGVILLLTGCHINKKEVSQTSEIPTIQIYTYKKMDIEIPDAEMVENQINEYIEPLIHTRVHVTFLPSSFYLSRIHQILDSSQQLDLFLLSSGNELRQFYKDKTISPLNDLLEQYAPDLISTVGEEYMQGGYDSDTEQYYSVPTCRDYSLRPGIEYRSDLAEQYHIDMKNVRTLSDLTEVFAALKKQNPLIYPLAPNGIYRNWDLLGDGLGVLMYDRMDTTVVNLYETEEYLQYLTLLRDWHQKGYLYDTSDNPGSNAYYLKSGSVFSCFANGKPGFVVQEQRDLNCSIDFIALEKDSISTDRISSWMWAVPQSSPYKKQAIQFLNLLYHDKNLVNLWTYGIEGIHYQILDEEKDIIEFPEGVHFFNSGYPLFTEYASGNQYLAHIWDGNPPTIWEEMKSFNDLAVRSTAFGFQYDDTAVKSEVIACSAVIKKYKDGFLHGIYDLDTVLPEFIQKLKEAGIDRIIDEKQRQLDSWLAR